MTAGDAPAYGAVTAYGDGAWLLEVADPVSVAAAARAQPGVEDAVAGEGCVVVRGALPPWPALAGAAPVTPRSHLLDIVYDGADLPDLPADAAARHAAGTYRVAFLGFSPGFAYLDGLDPGLSVPRLATPRPRVPAGAVGVADGRSCVYPAASPGGWRLVGRVVGAVLFDAAADPPALLGPGDTVRFRAVTRS